MTMTSRIDYLNFLHEITNHFRGPRKSQLLNSNEFGCMVCFPLYYCVYTNDALQDFYVPTRDFCISLVFVKETKKKKEGPNV